MYEDVLVFDIETDDIDVSKAHFIFFGGYSFKTKEFYVYDFRQIDEIIRLIQSHRVMVGFNCKAFDIPILEKRFGKIFFGKVIIDLYEISAPKGDDGYGANNKNRLGVMKIELENYKLETINQALKLDENPKGKIDYELFKKKEWTEEELKQIKNYLIQDLNITIKLFLWYEEQFAPLKELLPVRLQQIYNHLTSSMASLSYKITCSQTGIPIVFNSQAKKEKSFSGAHHINPRWEKVKGTIICLDVQSCYPNAIIQANLFSRTESGWDGNGFYKIEGCTDDKQQGKLESALKQMLMARLEAKKKGDKIKSNAYKNCINSLYGTIGNPVFQSVYDPVISANCTSIGRTWLKKLAKLLEENDFKVLYGFTDSVYVEVPKESSKEQLLFIVDEIIKDFKKHLPFPSDTFSLGIDHEIKFIWFIEKKHNKYLYVTADDKVEYTGTVLPVTTPKVIIKLFDEYMKPKIIKELDVFFSYDELLTELKKIIGTDFNLCAKEFNVREASSYKVPTSQQYKIVSAYGKGKHYLIPNNKIGIEGFDSLRYCTLEQFKQNNLTINDINFKVLMKFLDVFISSSKASKNKEVQQTLFANGNHHEQ